jgi:glycosyltransferase involved in cell wall biosynthesis
MNEDITVVIIGRNESSNLERTFKSVKNVTENIIFVDSNSTDNSVSIAKKYNIKKILRVKSNYGTAALSRQVGADNCNTEYIQFLDGDMTINPDWLSKAKEFLAKNKDAAIVHGYKRVYTKNTNEYFILSDKHNWEADYLQGAIMVKRDIFIKSGGYDYRIFGEEERDLYVRVKNLGYKVWYIHELMSSHYDFKKRTVKRLLFSNQCASIFVPFIKYILKINAIPSYIFVYRRLLPVLLVDLLTFATLLNSLETFFLIGIPSQIILAIYCVLIKRKGYFISWKVGFINAYRIIKIMSRKITYEVENHTV